MIQMSILGVTKIRVEDKSPWLVREVNGSRVQKVREQTTASQPFYRCMEERALEGRETVALRRVREWGKVAFQSE